MRRLPWAAAVLWLAVLVAVLDFAVRLAPRAVSRPGGGFASYYTSARLLREGADPSRFYDDDWFRARAAGDIPGTYREIYNTNPPTAALLLLPLTGVDHWTARRLFTLASALCLAASLWLATRELELCAMPAALLALYAVAAQPVRMNFLCGQAYAVLLLALVLSWIAFHRGRDGWAGALVAVLLVLKTQGAAVLLVAASRRRWRVLAAAAATALAACLVTLPLLGARVWGTYLRLVPTIATRRELATTAFQTATSVFRRLFTFDPKWSPRPLVDAPAVSGLLTLATTVVLSFVAFWIAKRDSGGDLAFGAAVAVWLIVTPVTVDYHFVLALLPIAVLLREAGAAPFADRLLLAAAMAAIGLDLQHPSTEASGWELLAHYPKLVGAALLVVVSARRAALTPVR